MLVESGGVPGICAGADIASQPPYTRVAVCLDRNQDIHFVWSNPTRLYSFARWLAEGRLKCDVALNFSGDIQAGWVQLPTTLQPLIAHGKVTAPLASAILLEELTSDESVRSKRSSVSR
jgi:uncharacterized protein YigE (DUF2233 family)